MDRANQKMPELADNMLIGPGAEFFVDFAESRAEPVDERRILPRHEKRIQGLHLYMDACFRFCVDSHTATLSVEYPRR